MESTHGLSALQDGEIDAVRMAMAHCGMVDPSSGNSTARLTYIVCQKRHKTRFFFKDVSACVPRSFLCSTCLSKCQPLVEMIVPGPLCLVSLPARVLRSGACAQDRGRTVNPCPGVVVDSEVNDVGYFNFYLNSHAAIQVTRKAHRPPSSCAISINVQSPL